MLNQNGSEESKTNFDASPDSLEEERRKEQVYKKIEQWKNHLLDLTRRNRLLYFTPTRRTTIHITSPSAQEIFTKIVTKGRILKFPIPQQEPQIMLPGLQEKISNVKPPSDRKSARPGDIESSLELQELQRNLYRLRRDWRTWQEEQGIHTLFLALGMLRWKESSHEQEECLTPLILVPVGLQKEGLNKPYLLEFVEEDIIINPVLHFKLEMDYNIHLPELPEDMDEFQVNKYLKQVSESILSQGWNVSEEVWLGRFSFVKFVMYKDLHNHREESSQHPIVAALAGTNSLPPPPDVPGLDRLDESIDVQEVFPILDADSSQLEILIRARQGQNMVVQGPPGTGKSQTIVNLIAQSLRDQKKVLFVSEKMAALEVVYHRLNELGLSFACLEVHSHRSNKAKVIDELRRTLQQYIKSEVPSDAADRFNKLTAKRAVLNQYVRELHKLRGTQKLTAYQIQGRLAKLTNMPNLEFQLPVKQILELSSVQQDKLQNVIKRLAQVPEVVDNYEGHPWAQAQIDLKSFSWQKRDHLLNAVESLANSIDSVKPVVQPLAEQIGLELLESLKRTDEFAELLVILTECQHVPPAWFALNPTKIHKLLSDADLAKNHIGTLFEARRKLGSCFSKKILEHPLPEILQRFYTSYKSFFRWLKANYWREMRALRSFWIGSRKMTYHAALEGLKAAVKVLNEESWLNKQRSELEKAFQDLYKGEKTDWDFIKVRLEWIERLLKWFSPRPLPERLVQLASEPNQLAENAQRVQTKLKNILDEMAKSRTLIGQVFKGQVIKGFVLDEAPFSVLRPWLNVKKHHKDLDDWVDFLKAQVDCEKHGLGEFLQTALQKKVRANRLEGAFFKRFWKGWLDEVYREAPILAEFRVSRHEEIIKEFCGLDQEMKKVTVAIIQDMVQKKQPKRSAAMADDSQVGILLREIQKRRRHKPLRRLFTEIPHLLQELKPCLLMSPLSVASYLTKGAFHFDLIIFDEASQIPPEDAIGTILRGRQLIVAGDNKQLPPTKFFQVDIDWDEEDESWDETPLESILDECVSLPQFVDSPLLWHYRSRHEELIAFSNRHFYENRLITFPSPSVSGFSGAIHFIHVPDGVYDRGGSRTNRREAQRVVDLIAEHLRKYGSRYSLGIITLSLAQEEAVLSEWEQRKLQEPDLAVLVDETGEEPFFIKALEKVQGDERDYIIISIGYGPDRDGKVHLHFGPLNQAGGERRLNVTITRARHQTTVVSSMLPHQLDLARLTTKHKGGVIFLQKYLEYAQQSGKFSADTTSTGEPETEFEEAVKVSLENQGFQVDAQVGCSEFRIDLAVRHPDHSNRYILGIECDGATYHHHRTARDRDRLRQEVLEELGWVIHRIWSTDWIKDPEAAINSVIKRVKGLRAQNFVGPPAPDTDQRKQRPPDTLSKSSNRNSRAENKTNSLEEKNGSNSVSSYKDGFSLPAYKQYVPLRKKSPELLYWEANQKRLKELIPVVQAVVTQESPVHIETVIQRVASTYGIDRVSGGTYARLAIEGAISKAVSRKIVKRRGDFLWNPNSKQILPRKSPVGSPHRPINKIATDELNAAVQWVLQTDFGLPRDALIRETARIFGYSRVGQNAKKQIEKSIDWLLKKGLIKVYGNQLTLVHKELSFTIKSKDFTKAKGKDSKNWCAPLKLDN